MSDAIDNCPRRESSMFVAADASLHCSEASGSSECGRSTLWAMDSVGAVESERTEVSERLAIIDDASNSGCVENSGGADDKCDAVNGGDSVPAVNGLRMRIKRTRDDSHNRHEIVQRCEDATSNHPTRVRRPPAFFSVQHPKPKRICTSRAIKQSVAASTTPVDQPKLPAVQSNCVSSVRSRGTQVSAAELGPAEPGTSIILQGYVWHETSNGLLVVSVTWRGRSYSGTLLDSTQHQWASSRPVAMEQQEASVRGFPVGLRHNARGRVRRRGRGRPRGVSRITPRSNLVGLDSITYTQKPTARFISLMPEPISNSDTEGSVRIISPLNYNPLCQSTGMLRSNVSSPCGNELIDCPCNGCHKQFANPDALCSHILHCHPVTSTAKSSQACVTNSSEENELERCSSTSTVAIVRDGESRDVGSPMMPCSPQLDSSTKLSISGDSDRPQSRKTDAELFQTLHRDDDEARGVRKMSSESCHSADEGELQIDWERLRTSDDEVDVKSENCGRSSSGKLGVSKDQLNEIRGRTLKVLVTDIALQSAFRKSEEASITQDFNCNAGDDEQLDQRSPEVVNEPASMDCIQPADPEKNRAEQRKPSESSANMSLPCLSTAPETQVHENQQNSIIINRATTGYSSSGSAVPENNFTPISSFCSPVTEAVIRTTTTVQSLKNAHSQSKDDGACSFSLLPGYQYPPGFPVPLVINTVSSSQTSQLFERNKRHSFSFPTGQPCLIPKSGGILLHPGPESNQRTNNDASFTSTEQESSTVVLSAGSSVTLPVCHAEDGSLPMFPTGKRRSSLIRPIARSIYPSVLSNAIEESPSVFSSAGRGSSSVLSTAGRGSPSVSSTAVQIYPSALSTDGKASTLAPSTAVQISPSALSTDRKASTLALSTAVQISPSALSAVGRESSSVFSATGRGSPSVLSTVGRGSSSVISTSGRGYPSVIPITRRRSSLVHRSTGVCLVDGSVPVEARVSCRGVVGSVPRYRVVSTQSCVSDRYLVSVVKPNEPCIRSLPLEPQRHHHRRSPPPLFPLRMVAPRSVPASYPNCTAATGAVPCVQTVCPSLSQVCPNGQPSDIWAQTQIPAVQTSSYMSLFPANMCIPAYLCPAGDHQRAVCGDGDQEQLRRSADTSCPGNRDEGRPFDDTQQNPASLGQVLATPGGLQPYPELFRAHGIPNQQSFQ